MTRRDFVWAIALRKAPAFSGTFLQLTSAHRDWPRERWNELFADFTRLGLSRLILQWTEGFVDLLPQIFDHAASSRMHIELGLTNEPRFWHEAPKIFDELRPRNKKLISSLRPFSSRPEFAGWYITEEIDEERWRDRKARRQLTGYLKFVRNQLRRAPVRISAFSNAGMPPDTLARFLAELAREARIDGLLFQDSIGANKLSLEALPGYYASLRALLGGRVEPVIEIFEQVRENPFEARPAPLARIQRQLEIARAAGFGPPMVFSVPEYRTPELISEFGQSEGSSGASGR